MAFYLSTAGNVDVVEDRDEVILSSHLHIFFLEASQVRSLLTQELSFTVNLFLRRERSHLFFTYLRESPNYKRWSEPGIFGVQVVLVRFN